MPKTKQLVLSRCCDAVEVYTSCGRFKLDPRTGDICLDMGDSIMPRLIFCPFCAAPFTYAYEKDSFSREVPLGSLVFNTIGDVPREKTRERLDARLDHTPHNFVVYIDTELKKGDELRLRIGDTKNGNT